MLRCLRVRVSIIVLLLVTGRAMAIADPQVIVLASADPAFRTALDEALAPTGLRVLFANDAPPAGIGDLTSASREIADREHATATVWLLFAADGGATLVAYDRSADRVLVRSLPYASPLDAAQAAEAARMARTMLRASSIPDPDPPPRVVTKEPVVPAIVTLAPPSPPHTLAIDVDLGVRLRGPGTTAAATGALAVTWRPDRLGLTLGGRFSPSAEVRTEAFMGQISDQSLALSARIPLRASRQITVAGTVGLAIHVVDLKGDLGVERIDDRRFDPAARVGMSATYALGPSISVGIAVSADWLLLRQTYETATEVVVLTVPVIQLSTGVLLTARIL